MARPFFRRRKSCPFSGKNAPTVLVPGDIEKMAPSHSFPYAP